MNYTADWRGLYREGWGDEIVPDAYAHPAKFARGLIRRIYEHLIERGYLKPGDAVVDPFGGVALGALDCMRLGCHWIGCELEQKFVGLGRQNIKRWNARYRPLWPETWGSAVLLQGDSRELGKLIWGQLGALVSSPPWERQLPSHNSFTAPHDTTKLMGVDYETAYGTEAGNLGNMKASDESLAAVISSPPFGEGETRDRAPVQQGSVSDCITRAYTQDKQGTTPGNLATMRAVVSSPPYSQTLKGGEGPGARYDFKSHALDNAIKQTCDPDYGSSPGQLAAMREGQHAEALVSSPPWQESLDRGVVDPAARRRVARERGISNAEYISPIDMEQEGLRTQPDYGTSPGQLAQEATDDFWTAARQIVDECYNILAPGAVAVWVVKRFVRNKRVVDFPDQWRQMCEAAGFVTVEWIRAWVVEEHGEQLDLFGNSETIRKERKSFFRRLYEAKAQARVFWSSVERTQRAAYLSQVHAELWQYYRESLSNPDPDVVPAPLPTRSRITGAAQLVAWSDAGKPRQEAETVIDWEDVIIMRRGP